MFDTQRKFRSHALFVKYMLLILNLRPENVSNDHIKIKEFGA